MTEQREGVALTSLDDQLFEGAGATKRDLLDHLEAFAERLLPELHDRPLSVVRVRPGQPPFMQKNLPAYAPEWVATRTVWSASSHREVRYPLAEDRRTLLWLGNQRAVELHPTLSAGDPPRPTRLVLDLDPPEGAPFSTVVAAASLVRQVLDDAGLPSAVKTSGAKGVHVVVPLAAGVSADDAAAATRALAARAERLDPALATTAFLREERAGKVFVDATRAGGATVIAVYSPRVRPGVPVSFPVAWDELASVVPADLTLRTARARLGDHDPWRSALPVPQRLPADVVAEGHGIPVARVAAMHEGKRRKRARGAGGDPSGAAP